MGLLRNVASSEKTERERERERDLLGTISITGTEDESERHIQRQGDIIIRTY